jgi:hypothetical protein
MSEESKAQEKSEAQKSWVKGPFRLSPSVDPSKFPWWPNRATMQRIEELQRVSQSWQKLMSPGLAALNEIGQQFPEGFGYMNRMMEQQIKLFQSGVYSAYFEQARKIHELASIDWEAAGREHAEGARELANRGWFITMELPFNAHRHFCSMIRDGRWEECERELQEHYEKVLVSIRDDLSARFPERKIFLEEAFALHCEGRFASAIPLFLAQSDGIGKSIFGTSPLSKSPKARKILKKWLDDRITGNSWFEEFWRSILRVLPIIEDTDKLDAYEDPLNRHGVLHGSDMTYGTKIKSLKAIAWIQYVASFATLDNQQDPCLESTSSS